MKNLLIALALLLSLGCASGQEISSEVNIPQVERPLDLRLRPDGYKVDFAMRKLEETPASSMVVNPWTDPLTWHAMMAIVLDWGTTLDIAKRGEEGWIEGNPYTRKVIGRQPDVSNVHQYFIGVAAIHLLARCVLPKEISDVFLIYAVIEHGRAGLRNHRVGLNMNF